MKRIENWTAIDVRLGIKLQISNVVWTHAQATEGRPAYDLWATVTCLCSARRTCGTCWRSTRLPVSGSRQSLSNGWRSTRRRPWIKVCSVLQVLLLCVSYSWFSVCLTAPNWGFSPWDWRGGCIRFALYLTLGRYFISGTTTYNWTWFGVLYFSYMDSNLSLSLC